MISHIPSTATILTRRRARQSQVSIISAEEARRLDRLELITRQNVLRELLQKSGWHIEVNSRVETILVTLLEQTGPALASSELAWALKLIGRDVKRNMLRKYVAGERLVKKEMGEGVWHLLFIPFLLELGCSSSQDGTTLGLSASIMNQLFSLVDVQITGLTKENRGIRLAESKTLEMTRKRKCLYFTFWCEREISDGSYILR